VPEVRNARDLAVSTFDGRVAVVTGASSGMGQATAWMLAERGAQVMAVDTDAAALTGTVDGATRPSSIRAFVADVTDQDESAAAVTAAVDAFGGVNILANIVGGSRTGDTVVEMPLEEFERVVRLNLTSVFLMCKAAIPHMITQGGGTIVNVASNVVQRGMRRNPAYMAAKGGVVTLTRSISIDGAEHNIRANCVIPGPTLSKTLLDAMATWPPEKKDKLAASTQLGRMADPRELAAVIVFLASDESSYIAGEAIPVVGGQSPFL
jgi:meso-butanediol dehydrogenase / (S,S)-butanediol dehydrogenase / diacetyl reductase